MRLAVKLCTALLLVCCTAATPNGSYGHDAGLVKVVEGEALAMRVRGVRAGNGAGPVAQQELTRHRRHERVAFAGVGHIHSIP